MQNITIYPQKYKNYCTIPIASIKYLKKYKLKRRIYGKKRTKKYFTE